MRRISFPIYDKHVVKVNSKNAITTYGKVVKLFRLIVCNNLFPLQGIDIMNKKNN